MKIQPLKGTRDFYPEIQAIQNYIFDNWKKICKKFGYEEFEGPLLESVDLWTEKSGEDITDQLYVFEDKGGRRITVRPELTPTLARMVSQKQKELKKPIKWFSIGRFWRYERPQSGRLREFYQLNVDCLGSDSMKADAEIIAIAIELMKSFGLDYEDFYIRVSNRKLIQDLILNIIYDESLLQDLARLIDKKDKLKPGDFALALKDIGLDENQVSELKMLLETDNIYEMDSFMLGDKGKEALEEFKELMGYLRGMGLGKYVKLDLSIMRGLDYYTSTVFEVFDKSGEYRALAGGGRYDNLVEQFGGEKCSGIGFGMGDVVLEKFLRSKEKIPSLLQKIDYYVMPLSDEVYNDALNIATILRRKFSVVIDVMGMKIRKQMDYANRLNAKFVVFVGEEEVKKNIVKIKNMETGSERDVAVKELKEL